MSAVDENMTAVEESGPQLRTLERGLQILSLFDIQRPEWTFGEVCRSTRLSKATAFRFLKKLEALEFLSYDERKRTYRLGSALLGVAYLASSHSEVVRMARPHLEKLAAETGEAVNIAMGTPRGPMIVDAVFAPNAFQPNLMVGVTLPGLATAHSRLFAAYADEKTRLAALLAPQQARTERTVTDPQKLAEVLAEVRQNGYSLTEGEWNVGACAVAAPVFDAWGRLKATIAVVVPRERFGPEYQAQYTAAVRETAARVTRELSGTAPSS
jgi:DNA-binding IclR family transcriptional regulator